METKLLNPGPPQIYAVILQEGDEVVDCLTRFARERGLDAAQITAIGAFRRVTLGYFEIERRDYKRIELEEQLELLSLLADVALDNDEPKLHAHVVLGRSDGSTCGGHLIQAWVRPTLEAIVTESPSYLVRRHDPQTGLSLIRT
jgi:predicted DNA-binding protein with PD1-like motif